MVSRHNDAQTALDFDRVTFDLEAATSRRDQGLAQASLTRKHLLELARLAAVRVARRCGELTYDDVFFELLNEGVDPTPLGNAAGCVFRGNEFKFTGRWEKSRRVSNHARVNRVWRLEEEECLPRLLPKKEAARASPAFSSEDWLNKTSNASHKP
jgi:hypothetical protein